MADKVGIDDVSALTKLREDLGLHRVIEPAGALPQAALRVDPSTDRVLSSELVLDVDTLNVDSASFHDLLTASRGHLADLMAEIGTIVRTRGKLVNPRTGSGGMLLGRVSPKSGTEALAHFRVHPGDRVATLVSLTLTPLHLESILAVDPTRHQVEVRGEAIVFATGMVAAMPTNIPERLALSLFDVAGAAPQAARLAQTAAPAGRAARILILGAGGKSGLLCAAAANTVAGTVVVGVEALPQACERASKLGAFAQVITADGRDPVAVLEKTGGNFDAAISCVNVEGAEMSAILSVRPRGTVFFFSMATSFSRAALGAEGVSKDVTLVMGNGYCEGHAAFTLDLVTAHPKLLELLA